MSASIESNMFREELEAKHGQTWDTTQLQQDFEVLGFSYGICVVRRKSDGQRGSLEFSHSPRVYYGFVAG